MRTNLIIVFALLIFLVGFFSTQISLTGQSTRSDFYTTLTNEELAEGTLRDLTVGDCRIFARIAAYGSRSNVPNWGGIGPQYSVTTKTQQTADSAKADLDGNGVVDFRDIDLCYNSVLGRGGQYGDSPSATRRSTQLNECSPKGKRTCRLGPRGHELAECAPDQNGILSWATVTLSGKAEKCINRLDGAILSNRIIVKQPRGVPFSFTAPSP